MPVFIILHYGDEEFLINANTINYMATRQASDGNSYTDICWSRCSIVVDEDVQTIKRMIQSEIAFNNFK